MNQRLFCDGLHRRDVLRIGTVGLFGGGISLSQLLQVQAATQSSRVKDTGASVIMVFLKGGLSTIDTFDMKPNAPTEIRGDFDPIATNLPGVQICEHLPRLAKNMEHLSLVRSFGHRNSDHGAADHYMLTGYLPGPGFNGGLTPNNHRPAHGSVIAKMLGTTGNVPPYICVPTMLNSGGPAYLGPSMSPMVIAADPNSPDFSVPDIAPPLTLAANRIGARRELLKTVDRFQKAAEAEANESARTVSVFRQKAFDLMTSGDAKRAFDIHAEPEKLRDEYGRNTLGQSCLMARRLVEAGVRCVTIEHANWDTHDNNFKVLKKDLLPPLDAALPTLFRDLADRGMLSKTLVIVTGEFGRTPRINKNAGRDHWGPSFTLILGGGGIKGGRVIGSSDARAERPAETPFGPEDMCATMCHLLGIDPNQEFLTPEGRPVKVVNNGKVIRGLL